MKTETYLLRDGSAINIPIPGSYQDCRVLIKSDYFRIYGYTDNFLKIWLKTFKCKQLKFLFWFRLTCYMGGVYVLCKLIHKHLQTKYGCQLEAGTKVGWGLYIGHGISMVITPCCIIGNNVNLSQMINIGTNEQNQAIIGDNVYIGPMSCIVEGVHIGNNVIIGAGSVVTRDIAPNSTAAGVPAKVIGPNKHQSYVQNRWVYRRR